jgi:FKBP-type peptidyl-prolyl cis-trans isomerase (trigger factor)
MAVKVTKDNAERLEATLSIGSEEMEAARQEVLQSLAPEVKLAGFRSGKVPAGVAEKHIDPSVMAERQLDTAIKKTTVTFLQDHEGQFINQPQLEVTKFVPGEMAEWTLKIDKVPAVKLGDYKKLKLKPTKKSAQPEPGHEGHDHGPTPTGDDLVEALVETSKVTTPEVLVEAHVKQMLQQIGQELHNQKKTMADFFATEKVKDEKELIDKKLRPLAIRRVKAELVLNALALELKITVAEEELAVQVTALKQRYASAEIGKVLDDPRVQSDIQARMRIDKTVAALADFYAQANNKK